MKKSDFIKLISEKVMLIRHESYYTQDRMSETIGISKKTLVQIEKGKSILNWSTAVTVCTIFRVREILKLTLGDDIQETILSIAYNGYENKFTKTMGGKVWWNDIKTKGKFKIQQNIISQHYRILDDCNSEFCSSFEFEYVERKFDELENTYKKEGLKNE